MPDLLLELFSEEIPARMQARAADDLKKLVTDRLVAAGLVARTEGRAVVVDLASASGAEYAAYDLVRDAAVSLGLPLIRLEHRRHRLEDLFRDGGGADDRKYIPARVG